MIGLLSIIVIGFFLGMRHATDPDHVIAVSTIVSQQGNTRRAAWIGIAWGLGHTVTIFAVGSAIILFGLVIPSRVGLAMELSVGVMLILLGAWNLVSFTRWLPSPQGSEDTLHSHPHRHGDYIHTHVHGHGPQAHSHKPESNPLARLDRTLGRLTAYQVVRPLVVGIVHGLAGSAAVALLILASIRNTGWAIAYLLVFGVGTIAGMMLITISIASAVRFVGHQFQDFGRRLALISGLISVAFGLVLAYQICVVQGIFTSSPQWTPR
ncbi:MAG TPA: high-affinity nickel-transport family protein [Terriglobales bacterium]|nr:high-affinity nickel-transport family protein [Terriglobales bacterium]